MNFVKKILALAAILYIWSLQMLYGQLYSASPYTRLGYGDIAFKGFSEQFAQAGITSTFQSNKGFSLQNPASLSSVRYTLFNFGLFGYSAELENRLFKQQQGSFGFNYVGLAVPLMAHQPKRGWGLAFGVTPYTVVNYESLKLLKTTNGEVPFFNVAEGTGGMSRFYMSTGFNLTKSISIGAGASYLFGPTEAKQTIYFPDSLKLLRWQEQYSTFQNGFVYDLGTQIQTFLKRDTVRANRNIIQVIGISGALSSKINTTTDYFGLVDGVQLKLEDTVSSAFGSKGSFYLPLQIRAGYSIEKLHSWQLTAEVQLNQFNQSALPGLSNHSTYRIGGYICPDYSATRKFFKTNVYRFGYFTGSTPYTINGKQAMEWGITAGLSIPVTVPYTGNTLKSGIHFSLEYGQRGAVNDNLIKEKYIRMILGFTLADRWFIKPKID